MRAARLGAGLDELGHGGQAGSGDERHLRGGVVGGHQGGQLGVDRVCRRGAVTEQGSPQGLDDPLGVRLLDGQPRGQLATGHDLGQPGIQVALADPAHDRVDEPGSARAVDLASQRHRLVDRGMGGHAHPQELVRAEPQRVQDVGIDLGHGAVPPRR